MQTAPWIFDFDNHYYESDDAFTRYADRSLRNRGVQLGGDRRQATIAGRREAQLLHRQSDCSTRSPSQVRCTTGTAATRSSTNMREAFGVLEPIRPEYRDRDARLRAMDEQGLAGALLFPTLGVGIEDALKARSGGVRERLPRVQPLARRRLGVRLRRSPVRRALCPVTRSVSRRRRTRPG